MKKLLLLFLILFSFASCKSNITPDGKITKEPRVISGFQALEVGSGIEVEFELSDRNYATVETFEKAQKEVIITNLASALIINLAENSSFDEIPTLIVKVYSATKLIEVKATEASHIKLSKNLASDYFEIFLSERSSVSMTEDDTLSIDGNLHIKLEQGSMCTITGTSESLNAELSGSTLSAKDFTAGTVVANVNMGSKMEICVSKKYSFTADGASTIKYYGDGKGTTYANGSSTIEHAEKTPE